MSPSQFDIVHFYRLIEWYGGYLVFLYKLFINAASCASRVQKRGSGYNSVSDFYRYEYIDLAMSSYCSNLEISSQVRSGRPETSSSSCGFIDFSYYLEYRGIVLF